MTEAEELIITDPADQPLPPGLLRQAVSAAASMLNVQSQNESDAMLADAFWAWPKDVRAWLFKQATDAAAEKTEQLRLKDESLTAQLTAAKDDVAKFSADLANTLALDSDVFTVRRVLTAVEDSGNPAPDSAVVGSIEPAGSLGA